MDNGSGPETLKRIREALDSASKALVPFLAGSLEAIPKSSGYGPVTEADRTVDRVLREVLLREGEGWLSEESVDDFRRLEKRSEEHTSELQSPCNLVCRLLLEKKKNIHRMT